MKRINRLIKKTAQKLGLQISRRNARTSPDLKIVAGLKNFDIDLVIDIGANEGQYAQELINAGYTGKIISFEPIQKPWEKLSANAKNYSQWIIYERCAVGEMQTSVEINISENSVSSSILKVLPAHLSSAPTSVVTSQESVPMIPLDQATLPIQNDDKCYLKIDAQGYESKVLDGAEKLLKQIKGVQIELSLVKLYDNQKMWREINDRLENLGFKLWAIIPGFSDPVSGQTLQFDGIFFRKEYF